VRALLDGAGKHRTLLATAIMAGGLRVSEVAGLRSRDVDLAGGRLRVAASKTEAGVREIDLSPPARGAHRPQGRLALLAARRLRLPDREGHEARPQRDSQEDSATGDRAGESDARRGGPSADPKGVTFHSLRHTYASLMAEAGVDAAYTKSQIGHVDARFTMGVYTTSETGTRPRTPA
jgi:integrase/recombinase XerD